MLFRMIRQATIDKWIGQRRGRLVILSFTKKVGRTEYFYSCRCDCGTVKDIRLGCLTPTGTTVSCGCVSREKNKERWTGNTFRRLKPGEANRNWVFKRYQLDAIAKNKEFLLTREQFTALTSQPCFYCDSEPQAKALNAFSHGAYIYNGIDRADNSLGYTIDNCVPACRVCNSLKNGITRDMVYRLYRRLFTESQTVPAQQHAA